MYEVDFSKPIHIHFIGIGGISMSGLAEILLKENFTISGSDAKESDLTRHLTSLGAQVFYGQKAENIIPGIDLVVYTAAIHPDNPEFAAAKAAGIPMLTRAELLGQIMRNYNTPIAVSGTHGKTTTTSMLSHILMAADCDPTISVGGILPSIGGNIRVGHSETFLTEACEYTNSFLSFFPKIGIILNMDADHLDFFKDIDDIRHSFREFARLLPADGMLIINADTPKYDYVTEGLGCKIVTYALENQAVADYTAANITYDEFDHPSFDCICRGELRGRYTLMVPGLHNVSNALAAIALADELQLPENAIHEGFATFRGTDRRFQYKGTYHGAKVIDDYAHHPTEIAATLEAARAAHDGRIVAVFQPHRYSRTQFLAKEFAHSLSQADEVVLLDVFPAGEAPIEGVSSHLIADQVDADKHAQVVNDEYQTSGFVNTLQEGDLVLVLGAGSVWKQAPLIVKALEEKYE